MRRLLMLGSDAADDTHLDAAVAALASLGRAERLTAVLVSLSADGDGSRYRNLLLRLDSALERDALREACKTIECAQGRRPNAAAMPVPDGPVRGKSISGHACTTGTVPINCSKACWNPPQGVKYR